MTSLDPAPRGPAKRVAVAAVPRLLSDSLQRVLADAGVETTIVLEPTSEHFDVAIVTPGAAPVSAEIVITLDDGADGQGAGIVTTPGHDDRRLEGLPSIVDFVSARIH